MRLLRGLGALAVILVGLVGVPVVLVVVGGDLLPDDPSWSSVSRALLRRDDGTVLIGLITVLAWIAWLIFALSTVVEIVKLVSGYRVDIALPGFGGPQRLVAGLLLAVLTMVPAQASHAAPTPEPEQPMIAAGESSQGVSSISAELPAAARSGGATAAPAPTSVVTDDVRGATADTDRAHQTLAAAGSATGSVHVVERGDDLWSLAEYYYGQGRHWRKIASANPELLTGGPDHLQTGWELNIPDLDESHATRSGASVVVEPGDSLSSLAEQAYGTPSRWPEIYDANRAQIKDPDDIDVGARLTLPALRSSDHQSRDRSPDRSRAPVHRERDQDDEVQRSRHVTPSPPERPAATSAPTPPASAPPPAPTTAAPPDGSTPSEHRQDAEREVVELDHVLGVGAVGGLLAAALLSGLAIRRRSQLQTRPLGRRIRHPQPGAQAVETALGRRQQPLSLRTLDLAIRAIAAHCHNTSTPLPPLVLARVGPELIELVMREPTPGAPVGFKESGGSWCLEHADASYLSSVPGVGEALRPFPALVSLGVDGEGNHVMADIESMGLLSLHADAEVAESVLAAVAVELSCSLWSDEMFLTLVGSAVELPEAMGKHNVTRADDLDDVLKRLERRASVQRGHQARAPQARTRVDPDLADAWAPEIVLINTRLSDQQADRLRALVTAQPRVTIAAVVADASAWTRDAVNGPWALVLHPAMDSPANGSGSTDSTSALRATLQPLGIELTPQLLPAPAQQAAVELLRVTGDEETTPAPWWHHETDRPTVPPPDNVTYLGKRSSGWGSEASTASGEGAEPVAQVQFGETGQVSLHHPVLQLLGPVELLGARGKVPVRAAKQCLEYCGWLLEHPGTTAQAMASALVVAEGTRRSNMSRLRTWLGVDAEGEAYLPDAYTGRILLHPSVSSDWQRLQILTAVGVNRTSTNGLRAALELVRGAPLADAAPGQWHWAEELRTDMISAVRDIGVELSSRALREHDLELARWAAARALAAAPGDELLLAARIRTEHLAGNIGETERLALQLAAQARTLGVDLDGDTVVLLQEVMEGRVRARMA